MVCRGVVRGRQVELEGDITLPEGTRVQVIPEEPGFADVTEESTLKAWLIEARRVRSAIPETADSTELLREIREGRARQ